MGHYDFQNIEQKWQANWKENRSYAVPKNSDKPKFYALDMFPYPSGAGLHVGHPLGYTATDIVTRYKRLKGFNVLHPMGFDAFGLPAEQYAIETGTHPAVTTEKNILRFTEQLEMLGLSHDPDSRFRTCDPEYYKWTQWIFLKLFNAWYDKDQDKARPIEGLIAHLEKQGTEGLNAHTDFEGTLSSADWKGMSEEDQQKHLLEYRLMYISEAVVNWCPALGTVLANDEVVNGVSERGGHPVERRPMRQWSMRMTAYSDRLLNGLDTLDWPHPITEMQRNWIGRSEGANFFFEVANSDQKIEVFTTRPDTTFGATFMVLAPEHPLVSEITTSDQQGEVEAYIEMATNKTELERMTGVKNITGAHTGAYAINPFTGKQIPIWISEYVLWGYGTGAIMAVPAHDQRDYDFAKHFGIEIIPVYEGGDISEAAFEAKDGTAINSDFLNGMKGHEAIPRAIEELEKRGLGHGTVNFRLRDPNYSRQRYWGEPIPIKLKNGIPYALDESELPLTLPEVESYTPTGTGESPLAKVTDWVQLPDGFERETHTMPGYAGSSWYFLRYLDPFNEDKFVDGSRAEYWMNVDLYIGGAEHAVGHLLYSRFWNKVLFDLGLAPTDEPFQKLINQGMIQGRSLLIHRVQGENKFVSHGLADDYETDLIHIPVQLGDPADAVDLDQLKNWKEEFAQAEYVREGDKFVATWAIEKMGKRYHNAVNPEDMCQQYGADTFRLYLMFLGPLEDSKPFILNGIEGVVKFLKKVWALLTDDENNLAVTDEALTPAELKLLHGTIKKVGSDIERLSLNTTVAQFMIFANDLTKNRSPKRALLEPFIILLSPYAPHFAEEAWQLLGHETSILDAAWPEYDEKYLVEDSYEYPVQVNGKLRAKVSVALGLSKDEIQEIVLNDEEVKALIGDKALRKVIVVPGRIVNLVM